MGGHSSDSYESCREPSSDTPWQSSLSRESACTYHSPHQTRPDTPWLWVEDSSGEERSQRNLCVQQRETDFVQTSMSSATPPASVAPSETTPAPPVCLDSQRRTESHRVASAHASDARHFLRVRRGARRPLLLSRKAARTRGPTTQTPRSPTSEVC